jgi:hypothetical protein
VAERLEVAGVHRSSFWVTNRVANPLLRWLLRGPLGGRMGKRLALLRYNGRRTGQPHELVVQYVRDEARVWVLVGLPERKHWWRNMLEPTPVSLRLAGRDLNGVAETIDDRQEPGEFAAGLAAYIRKFPRASKAADRSGAPTVMVRIDLDRGMESH